MLALWEGGGLGNGLGSLPGEKAATRLYAFPADTAFWPNGFIKLKRYIFPNQNFEFHIFIVDIPLAYSGVFSQNSENMMEMGLFTLCPPVEFSWKEVLNSRDGPDLGAARLAPRQCAPAPLWLLQLYHSAKIRAEKSQ